MSCRRSAGGTSALPAGSGFCGAIRRKVARGKSKTITWKLWWSGGQPGDWRLSHELSIARYGDSHSSERLERVAMAAKAPSAMIPIPLVGFKFFWGDLGIKVNPRKSRHDPKESASCCVVRSTTGASWSNGPTLTPCFVSVQNAREHGANLSSEC